MAVLVVLVCVRSAAAQRRSDGAEAGLPAPAAAPPADRADAAEPPQETPPVGGNPRESEALREEPLEKGGRGRTPPKRPLPDYDGRGPRPRPGDAPALLPLRLLLSPLYFITEYGINRPLGALLTKVEGERWPGFVFDLFDGPSVTKLTVLPSAYVEFGFRPSVGAYLFWDELGAPWNDVRAELVTWGPDW